MCVGEVKWDVVGIMNCEVRGVSLPSSASKRGHEHMLLCYVSLNMSYLLDKL